MPMPKKSYKYMSYTVDADPETLTEEANRRAKMGWRLAFVHFYGTASPQATLIFERRLRARPTGDDVDEAATPPPPAVPL